MSNIIVTLNIVVICGVPKMALYFNTGFGILYYTLLDFIIMLGSR